MDWLDATGRAVGVGVAEGDEVKIETMVPKETVEDVEREYQDSIAAMERKHEEEIDTLDQEFVQQKEALAKSAETISILLEKVRERDERIAALGMQVRDSGDLVNRQLAIIESQATALASLAPGRK